MAKFRKKPVVIEAFIWTGGPDQEEDPEWIIAAIHQGIVWFKDGFMIIHTLEGDHQANPGDYIIQGVKGEIYPCKPDIFEKTYEPVSASVGVSPSCGQKLPLETYIGSKIIRACPMTKLEFAEYKGQPGPEENQDGYLVLYADGYASWSPKDAFEGAYRLLTYAEKLSIE